MKILAIGDIHGHLGALDALLAVVRPAREDQIVFLGDYVDKGPNVKGVIERLLEFDGRQNVVFLRGNHDQMMIDARRDGSKAIIWETLGGNSPLASYGTEPLREAMALVPSEHWEFLENRCCDYFETAEHIFVHGGIRAHVDPIAEEKERLLWSTLSLAEAHHSGRTVVCGHSSQRSGRIADLGHTICLDTGIAYGGWLTCLEVGVFEFWQANEEGASRVGKLRR